MKVYVVIDVSFFNEEVEALNDKFYFSQQDAVKAILEDSGYTSIKALFEDNGYEEDPEEDVSGYMSFELQNKNYYIKELENSSGLWAPSY